MGVRSGDWGGRLGRVQRGQGGGNCLRAKGFLKPPPNHERNAKLECSPSIADLDREGVQEF